MAGMAVFLSLFAASTRCARGELLRYVQSAIGKDDGQDDADANIVAGRTWLAFRKLDKNFAELGASDLLYVGEVARSASQRIFKPAWG